MSHSQPIPLSLPASIATRLDQLQIRIREWRVLRGLGRWLVLAVALCGTGLLLNWKWDLPIAARMTCTATIAGVLVFAAFRWLLTPLSRSDSPSELAALAERIDPELKERLTSLVELSEATATSEKSLGSPAMRALLAAQVQQQTRDADFSAAIPWDAARKSALWGMAAIVVLLLPFGLFGSAYSRAWGRLVFPFANTEWGPVGVIRVVDGDRVVPRGSDVEIQAECDAPSATIGTVWLNWTDSTGKSERRRMERDGDRFKAQLAQVQSNLRFDVSSTAARSRSHQLTVADPPEITRWEADVQPPAYTGMAATQFDAVPKEWSVLAGSQIQMRWKFNQAVADGNLNWNTDSEATSEPRKDERSNSPVSFQLAPERNSATGRATAENSGTFQLSLKNELGLKNVRDASRHLTVIPDRPPTLALAGSEDSLVARPDDVVPILLEATDDFGFTALELHGDIAEKEAVAIAAPVKSLAGRKLTHQFDLNLKELSLRDGQILTYRVRVVDNRQPNPQEVWSPVRSIRIDSKVEMLADRQLAERNEPLMKQLDELESILEQQRKELKEMHQAAVQQAQKPGEPVSQETLEKQQDQVAQVQQQADALAEKLQQNPLFSELAKQTQQAVEEPLQKAREKLEQAEKLPPREQVEKISQALDQLSEAEKRFEKIEQELNELQRLQKELRQLNDLAKQSEDLARKAEQLAQQADAKTSDQKAADSKQAQAQLMAEQQQLSEKLDELLRQRPELLEAARQQQQDRVAELAKRAEQLAKAQEKLADDLKAAAPDQPAPNNDSNPAKEKPNGSSSSELAKQLADLQREQDRLVQQATNQARQTAQQVGADAAATKSALETARPAVKASEELQNGRLAEAAASAEQAAQAAERNAQTSPPNQANEARQLAEQQRSVAEKLQEMAQSPEARQTAREQAQSQLQQGSKELANQLAQASERMASDPLNAAESAKSSAAAAESARQANQQMQASQQAQQNQDGAKAANAAQQAAQQLQQAAKQASEAGQSSNTEANGKPNSPANSPSDSAVPNQLGGQLAEASRQLRQAGQSLAQSQSPMPPSESGPQGNMPPSANGPQSTTPSTPMPQNPNADPANSPNSPNAASPSNAGQPQGNGNRPDANPSNSPNSNSTPGDSAASQSANGQPSSTGQPASSAGQPAGQNGGSPSQGSGPSQAPGSGQPGDSSMPSHNPGQSPSNSPGSAESLGQAAQQLKAAANALNQAAQQFGPQNGNPGNAMAQAGQQPGSGDSAAGQKPESGSSGQPGNGTAPSESSGPGTPSGTPQAGGTGALTAGDGSANLNTLEADLKKQAGRDWGKLPGNLRTEILQGANRKSHGEYSRQIKSYFEQVAQPAGAKPTDPKPKGKP